MKSRFPLLPSGFRIILIAAHMVAIIFLSSSCDITKRVNRDREIVQEHHYHDSTFTVERETIREVMAGPDSTKAYFDLQELLKNGYAKSTDRYFTTEIRYENNGLIVSTTIDSLMTIVRELQREKTHISVQSETDINNKSKSFDKDVEANVSKPLWILLIVIILVIGVYIYFKYFHTKKKPDLES